MLKAFQNHILSLEKNPPGKKYLLAVSGGLDSAAMAEMFLLVGYDFTIAHCNFQLRGEESDGDEKFVKELATKYEVPFYSIKFETEKYCKENKVSVQMGARQLRYEWLENIRKENKLDYLVTAHHADDSIETFFINLLRGTGLSGLHGIKAKNENVIRPMLGFYRNEIEKFANENNLEWREDSSNETDKYERNKIRHHLVPLLEEINPKAKVSIALTVENIWKSEHVLNDAVEREVSKYSKSDGSRVSINTGLFKELNFASEYLFESIKKFGFNYNQCELISEAAKGQPGKIFLSDFYRLLVNRDTLIIEPVKISEGQPIFEITEELEELFTRINTYQFRKRENTKDFKIPTEPDIAALDYEKITFPLQIRRWVEGDKFYPLGMTNTKKVSDFLIDSKVNLFDKENVHVLVSGGEIAWVIGHRPDERFKVTGATKKLYLCNSLKTIIQ